MNILYLAWQDQQSRRWFPVGRLVVHRGYESEATEYKFDYLGGVCEAQKSAKFHPIVGFPDLTRQYISNQLFPLFQNRVMNRQRPDRPKYLRRLGLDEGADEVTELAISGGSRRTDSFAVFPPLSAGKDDGRFRIRSPLHELRGASPASVERAGTLEQGEGLVASFDPDNPTSTHAIAVKTKDRCVLGWLPRYLVDALYQDDAWRITGAKATVAQVNRDGPLQHRLLIDFSGKLDPGFRPMDDLPQYQPIGAASVTPYPTNKSSGRNADTT